MNNKKLITNHIDNYLKLNINTYVILIKFVMPMFFKNILNF